MTQPDIHLICYSHCPAQTSHAYISSKISTEYYRVDKTFDSFVSSAFLYLVLCSMFFFSKFWCAHPPSRPVWKDPSRNVVCSCYQFLGTKNYNGLRLTFGFHKNNFKLFFNFKILFRMALEKLLVQLNMHKLLIYSSKFHSEFRILNSE